MATETKQVEDPQRLGLVLSGGGARGAFQVGVYERMLADPRFSQGPAILSGTSAGAINAALIAAGRTPQEMLRFWHGLAERPPAVASDSFMHHARQAVVALAALEPGRWVGESSALAAVREHLRHHLPLRPGAVLAWMLECAVTARFEVLSELLERIPDAHLFDTGPLRERLIEEFGGERIPHRPGVELAINVVDAPSGRAVRFTTFPSRSVSAIPVALVSKTVRNRSSLARKARSTRARSLAPWAMQSMRSSAPSSPKVAATVSARSTGSWLSMRSRRTSTRALPVSRKVGLAMRRVASSRRSFGST